MAERWVWTNEKPYFSYVEISALRTDTGIRTQTNFTSEKTAASARAIKALVMGVWL